MKFTFFTLADRPIFYKLISPIIHGKPCQLKSQLEKINPPFFLHLPNLSVKKYFKEIIR